MAEEKAKPKPKKGVLNHKGQLKNSLYAQLEHFKAACKEHGVVATKRQASKFRNKQGALWNKTQGRVKIKATVPMEEE